MNKAYDKKRQTITIFITIFLFWLLLSGLYTPFMLLLGIISSLGITLIITKMNILIVKFLNENWIYIRKSKF